MKKHPAAFCSTGKLRFDVTDFGFQYGAASVSRLHSDQTGEVWIEVKTPRQSLTVRVTPSGLIEPFNVTDRDANNG